MALHTRTGAEIAIQMALGQREAGIEDSIGTVRLLSWSTYHGR